MCQPEAGFVVSLVELQCWDVLNLALVNNEDDAEGDIGDDPNCDVDYDDHDSYDEDDEQLKAHKN